MRSRETSGNWGPGRRDPDHTPGAGAGPPWVLPCQMSHLMGSWQEMTGVQWTRPLPNWVRWEKDRARHMGCVSASQAAAEYARQRLEGGGRNLQVAEI